MKRPNGPIAAMVDTGFVPVFHHEHAETACAIVDALVAGGASVIEFTDRSEGARSVFDRLVEHVGAHHPNVWLGVGSIVEATTAAAYSAAGAAFVVGPTTEDGVAATCRDVGVPYVPGAATPTEIRRAVSVGNGLIKIFPADAVGGPGFVAAILGPMPGLRLMPTGGVGTSEVELRRWFDAGVTCVGLGGALISQDVLAASDWSALAAHTASVAKTIESIRRP